MNLKEIMNYKLKLLSAIAVMGLSSQLAYAEGMEWQIAPYLWTFDTALDVTVNSDPALGIDAPFKDVIDKLDGAFMGHVEGRGEKFGVFGDALLVDLVDSKSKTIGPGGPILGDILFDTSLELRMYEIGGFYRIGDPATVAATFDLMLGARMVDVDQKLGITLPGPDAGNTQKQLKVYEKDAFIGGRVIGQISERWHYKARVDMGGGGTDGTLNMMAAVGYTFGQTGLFSMDFGYKYMSIDLTSNDGVNSLKSKIEMSGPLIGFVFNF